MVKYSTKQKLKVIRHYLSKCEGFRRTSARFSIPRNTLRRWVTAYQVHGMGSLKGGRSVRSTADKARIIRTIEKKGISILEACARFNISGATTILRWQRLYNAGGINALNVHRKRPKPMSAKALPFKPTNKPIAEMTPKELARELQYRRAEVDYLKKLDALIREQKLAQKTKC
jgi:transposase